MKRLELAITIQHSLTDYIPKHNMNKIMKEFVDELESEYDDFYILSFGVEFDYERMHGLGLNIIFHANIEDDKINEFDPFDSFFGVLNGNDTLEFCKLFGGGSGSTSHKIIE